jgi:hypothetical protein
MYHQFYTMLRLKKVMTQKNRRIVYSNMNLPIATWFLKAYFPLLHLV